MEIVWQSKKETEELRLKILHLSYKINSPDGDHPGGKPWRMEMIIFMMNGGGGGLLAPVVAIFSHHCVEFPDRKESGK